MATENTFSQQLLDLLSTRNFHPEMRDLMGNPTNKASDSKTLTFDYISSAGKNYGTMVIILDIDNDMKIMYGDNLGRTMTGDDKQEFFNFIAQLNKKAVANRWTHTSTDISQLKHVMQGIAAIQEGLFEGYYGNRKISWTGNATEARLRIVHNRVLDENDARHRYIDRMFIETVEGECFRLGFKSLAGGKAMLEHVRQGGKPYDVRGCHITEMVNEIAVLSRFNRASAQRILEGVTQTLVTEAQTYYQSLRENLKLMSHSRGYQRYFESWHPATITEQDDIISNIKTLFIEQTIDSRIEAALPLLAKIQQQGESMKEVEIFEAWASNLVEGTWSLPETPEQLNKLKSLMTKELIVGPDATNATEQLYDLVGDDILFDRLSELAARDPRANAWNDTEVMNRLRELGIETPGQAPAGVQQSVAPASATAAGAVTTPASPVPPQGVAEDAAEDAAKKVNVPAYRRKQSGDPDWRVSGQDLEKAKERNISGPEGLRALQKRLGMKEAAELSRMMQLAQVPVHESVLTDSTGHTLDHILQRFSREVAEFKKGADLDQDLYDALYDYYFDDMPYGVKKARTGDPYEWVTDRLDQELGTGNHAPRLPESGCNMTAEGEYCPRHGLAECAMEEDAAPFGPAATAAIQQGKPPTEVHHADTGDKMNAAFQNTLMKESSQSEVWITGKFDGDTVVTDSFYESKADDALLARIKSLALIR